MTTPDTCPHCGAQNPPGARFCRQCGRPIVVGNSHPKPSHKGRNWLIALLVAVIAALLAYLYMRPEPTPLHDLSVPAADTASVQASDDKAPSEQVAPAEEEKPDLDWSGKYELATYAGRTAGGTGVVYGITFTMHRVGSSDDYTGELEIDGWQTGVRGKLMGNATDNNRLTIYYEADTEENGLPSGFNQGDTMIELTWKDNEMKWETYIPMQDYVNEYTKMTFNNGFAQKE